MVNFRRIEQYNQINSRLGDKDIDIRTPKGNVTMKLSERIDKKFGTSESIPALRSWNGLEVSERKASSR